MFLIISEIYLFLFRTHVKIWFVLCYRIACRNNVCICFMFLDNTCGKREMGSYVYCAVDVRVVLWLLPIY